MSARASCIMLAAVVALAACDKAPPPSGEPAADVLIVGAGIAGLSAAYEAERAGRSVLLVDMMAVFGGHAMLSHGGLSIVDTPLQRKRGVADSPDLAYADFRAWGEDNNEAWLRYYVDHSTEEIYDWLTALGAEFTAAVAPSGNSVPRYHFVRDHGLGLVMPIYRAVREEPDVRFLFNTRVDELIRDDGRVVGVRATDLRDGQQRELFAGAVLIATGGLQGDLDKVRANWRADLPQPERLLAGVSRYSRGSGLELAGAVGAQVERLDHQWNYVTGIPDPRYPGQSRGLSFLPVPPGREVWVNANGERFVNECKSSRDNLAAVLDQPGDSHWVVFDAGGKKFFIVSGSGWTKARTERWVFGNADLIKTAPTLAGLAAAMGVDADRLERTVNDYNDRVDRRAAPQSGEISRCGNAKKVDRPPYYAARRFILTRKTMGGIRIDAAARVVDGDGIAIPGLYAAGEASGFAGINGRAALEGTHLGPSIVTGRMAGRQMAAELAARPVVRMPAPSPVPLHAAEPVADRTDAVCAGCHDLSAVTQLDRPGYSHFRWSHRMVNDERMACIGCHEDLFPYRSERHRQDLVREADVCAHCHGN